MSLPLEDSLNLLVILAWLRANWLKIMLGGFLCGVLAFPVVMLRPKTYASTATLLVSPPMFKDRPKPPPTSKEPVEEVTIAEMMPKALPVEAYKAIALSAPLLDEVIKKVPLQEVGVNALKSRLEVELVQLGSRSAQGIAYTQTLMFHTKADSPELAAKIAQTWAEVFKAKVDGLAIAGVKETFGLLDTLHNQTKTDLQKAELALAEHQKAWNLELIKAQLEAKQKKLTLFEDDLKQAEVDLSGAEMKAKALEDELAKEPEKRVYFRAPSDDAYWTAALEKGQAPKLEPEQGLRTEQVNENYVTTRDELVKVRGEVEGLRAKKAALVEKIDEMQKEMEALTAVHSDKTVERDVLMRESENLQKSYQIVRTEYEKGRIAEHTQASDIVIANAAVILNEPVGLGHGGVVVAAAFLGMVWTVIFLAFKELTSLVPEQKHSASETNSSAEAEKTSPQKVS